jgi:hypothetical protein
MTYRILSKFRSLVKRLLFVFIEKFIGSAAFLNLTTFFLQQKDSTNLVKMQRYTAIKWLGFLLLNKQSSHSQLSQDIWVLYRTHSMRKGYFVEVGSCHPTELNNTFLLESKYGWGGLLIEPNPLMTSLLRKERSSTVIEAAIADGEKVQLSVADIPEFSSTIEQLDEHTHPLHKSSGTYIEVVAKRLTQVFDDNNVPADFDFLSLDIEGGEEYALKSIDFARFRPKLISVEHNFTASRDKIQRYLELQGYIRDPISLNSSWDDWYIEKGYYSKLER